MSDSHVHLLPPITLRQMASKSQGRCYSHMPTSAPTTHRCEAAFIRISCALLRGVRVAPLHRSQTTTVFGSAGLEGLERGCASSPDSHPCRAARPHRICIRAGSRLLDGATPTQPRIGLNCTRIGLHTLVGATLTQSRPHMSLLEPNSRTNSATTSD